MKIAIIYDWIDKIGGVERMLTTLHEMFPDAVFYTSVYEKEKAPWASNLKIKTSFIQSFPKFLRSNRVLMSIFYPYAFESFDLKGYDVVLSVSSSFAKGIITRPETKHISIVLSTPRYLWELRNDYLRGIKKTISLPLTSFLRKWDFIAGQRPDTMLAISKHVAARSKKTYHREAEVVYPPFDTDYWSKIKDQTELSKKKEYYLVVARLEPYKKIDVVISAFKQMPEKKLVIIGVGSEKKKLMNQASGSKNISFIENCTDRQLGAYYSNAIALVMLQEEDFGYTAVEALYFDCPVVSYSRSGVAEILQEGKTGTFVQEQTPEALTEKLASFESMTYNVYSYKKEILNQFSRKVFKDKLNNYL